MSPPCDEPFEDVDYLAGEDVGAELNIYDKEDECLPR